MLVKRVGLSAACSCGDGWHELFQAWCRVSTPDCGLPYGVLEIQNAEAIAMAMVVNETIWLESPAMIACSTERYMHATLSELLPRQVRC